MLEPADISARPLVLAPLLALLLCSGCIGHRLIYPVMPTAQELHEFQAAGPADVQVEALETGSMRVAGPYRVVAGDLLTIELPPEVNLDAKADEGSATSIAIKCRVKETGAILMPMVGDFAVAGKTTGEIEDALAQAYHDPARLKERPNVVATVTEFRTVSVAVIGAVNQPGLVDLKSDHLSVVGALMAAGGIKAERGAKQIKVIGQDEQGDTVTHTLAVQLSDIPLEDLALRGGETIVVEPPTDRQFCVIGLVKKSGSFVYPPPRHYNLMQALATAGGVDEIAAPRYATVYRVRADGKVVGATFKIDGTGLTDAANVTIKDGDVIAVEHTPGSWLRQFFSQVLGFRASYTATSSATL